MDNNNIIFEFHNVSASEPLETFTKEKLEMIFTRFDFVHRADVFFKLKNTSSNETGKKCGIRLSAPGPRLFAESSHNTFQEAVMESVNELKTQLHKRKELIQNY